MQCSGSPCALTGQLSILVDGNEVDVRKSASADLGDITSLAVSPDGNNFALTIEGGDAIFSYVVRLIFDKHSVLERRLYPCKFREFLAETTRYYTDVVSDN